MFGKFRQIERRLTEKKKKNFALFPHEKNLQIETTVVQRGNIKIGIFHFKSKIRQIKRRSESEIF